MIEIKEFQPWHLEFLSLREEQQSVKDNIKLLNVDLESYGELLYNSSEAYSYIKDGEVLISTGIMDTQLPHIKEAWALFSKNFKTNQIGIIKRIKRFINDSNYERLQAYTDLDFTDAQEFLMWLGFEKEGVLRKSGIDKKDIVIYSIIR